MFVPTRNDILYQAIIINSCGGVVQQRATHASPSRSGDYGKG